MKYTKKRHKLGFWQADPTPSQEELQAYYRNAYYQKCTSVTYAPDYTVEELEYTVNRAVVAEKIFRQFGDVTKKTPSLFDIGCGEGFFVNYFSKRGWETAACDFSSFGVEKHNPEIKPCFLCGDIYETMNQKIEARLQYDFVNFSNVLEHVREPLDVLEKIKGVMHPGSLLRVSVPNDFSPFQNLLMKNRSIEFESWFSPCDHLNYFTFPSLENTLVHSGFEVVKMMSDFPIELFLANEHSNYWKDRGRGKQAHLARITIDNFLVRENLDAYIAYMSEAGKLGFGRSVIAYARITR